MHARLLVHSRQQQCLEDITDQVREAVRRSGMREGLCHLYVPHTTAGIVVNENADPDVARDIIEKLEALVPRDARYRHYEGNAHAHIKASLVGQWALLPVASGDLALGRWQGIFLAEFDGPRERTVLVTLVPSVPGGPGESGP
ncbi:MAG: secondary thiamine-phosphate synthase enzyme YjbQ [Dehalococcoidia bacterium]|nr:secondary thiamine-phosphate synthase enzyme YjbQ [Dehalococcoidia bacterium]MDW8009288.1 secondary thiamine-phosphate synthase enzyme YjbQ [Chloroflexota bacterium]